MTEGAVHGGISSEAGLDVDPSQVVDLSANLNPLGPPDDVLEAAMGGVEEVETYPEPYSRSLRRYYSRLLGLGPEEVLLGGGSTELIFLAASLCSGGSVAVGSHSFAEYPRAARAANASLVEFEVGIPPRIEDFYEAAGEADGVFLCSPHNPSGSSVEGIRDLVEDEPETLFFVDRAYTAFEGPDKRPEVRDLENAVEIFSLTKAFAIPGLRVGYLAADRKVVDAMLDFKQPWSLGQPAERAAKACLGQDEFLEESRREVEVEREFLKGRLEEGFDVTPSDSNFVLLEVGDARSFKEELLRDGFLVRDCSSFGLPSRARIAVGTRDVDEALLDTLGL